MSGGLYAFAEPRGNGKTTRVRMAALWAISYAHCRYVFVIGANAEKATDTVAAIKTYIRFLPAYAEDFPEIAHPARSLGGIANRSQGQLCDGQATLIEWSADRIVLPTVKPPKRWRKTWGLRADGMVPTSGCVVSASGLTGDGIRGSLLTLSTGESIRPDLVLLDDPQTNESAHSLTQNATREQLVSADVLGMAGPGKSIAAVMPCTVIAPGDFVDKVLDRSRHPVWCGERTGILRAMPKNIPAWEEYFDVYRSCVQESPPDLAAANAAYTANRELLEEGTEASWPNRKLPGEVSAIQHAMHLYCRDPRTFMAEYMNDPQPADRGAGAKSLDAAGVVGRLSGLDVRVVPRECSRLTTFIDPGLSMHWYALVAWTERFGGSVVDYGTWPRQHRRVFAATDGRPSLADVYPGRTEPQLVYAGLESLTADVLGRVYLREGGGELKVERCLIDSGWQTSAVYQFARQSVHHGVLYPSKGIGRTATARGISEWKPRPGERSGHFWRLTIGETGRGRAVQFDPDAWKTFLHSAFTTPQGGLTGLTFWGKKPVGVAELHAMIGSHCAAEYSEPVTLRGSTFDKWQVRVDRPDNHLWDCLVGAAVAAGVQGLQPFAAPDDPHGLGARAPAPKPKLSDLQRARRLAAPVR